MRRILIGNKLHLVSAAPSDLDYDRDAADNLVEVVDTSNPRGLERRIKKAERRLRHRVAQLSLALAPTDSQPASQEDA